MFRYLMLVFAFWSGAAISQNYPDPSKPIKIVVPFGTGSSADLLARAVARGIEDQGLKAIVDNKPGAAGIIGMREVKNAQPDGYTMVFSNLSTQVLNQFFLPELPYDPVGDFTPIMGIGICPLVLNMSTHLPFTSATELIDAAKKNPGKYRYGSATSTTQLAAELLNSEAGIAITYVPYKAMAQASLAMASGEVDIVFNDAITSKPFYDNGRVRPLAITGPTRIPQLPNVPTLQELGVDYDFTPWLAAYFPAKTPSHIVSAMQEILKKSIHSTYVIEAMEQASYVPLAVAGTELTVLQRAESEKWGKLVEDADLKPK